MISISFYLDSEPFTRVVTKGKIVTTEFDSTTKTSKQEIIGQFSDPRGISEDLLSKCTGANDYYIVDFELSNKFQSLKSHIKSILISYTWRIPKLEFYFTLKLEFESYENLLSYIDLLDELLVLSNHTYSVYSDQGVILIPTSLTSFTEVKILPFYKVEKCVYYDGVSDEFHSFKDDYNVFYVLKQHQKR